jgi:hypothetical protein
MESVVKKTKKGNKAMLKKTYNLKWTPNSKIRLIFNDQKKNFWTQTLSFHHEWLMKEITMTLVVIVNLHRTHNPTHINAPTHLIKY